MSFTWPPDTHQDAQDAIALTPSSGDDSVQIRAALTAGARHIRLLGGETYTFNTSIGDDLSSTNDNYTITAYGATCVINGASLGAAAQFSPDPTVKWLFYPNTSSSAVNGNSTVQVTTANRATGSSGASSHRLRIYGGLWNGQGGNIGLAYGNLGPTRFDGIIFSGMRVGMSWAGYQDGNEIRRSHFRSPNTDSWMMWQTDNGDCIILDGIKCDPAGGIWNATVCRGGEVRTSVGGHLSFKNCAGITVNAYHLEVDIPGMQTNGNPGINIINSQVTVSDTFWFASKYAGIYPIYIDDVPGEKDSAVTVVRNRFQCYYRSGDVDTARTPDIYLNSFNDNSQLVLQDVTGSVVVQNGDNTVKRSNWLIGSADSGITAAIADVQGQVATRPTILRSRSGGWVFEPFAGTAKQVRALPAPTIAAATTTAAAAEGVGGTLTVGGTYQYVAAMLDEEGQYTTLSSAVSYTGATGAGASGSIRLGVTTNAPGTLRLWRKHATGVTTAPDAYVDLPVDTAAVRVYDTGVNANGIPWDTTGVPVPNTVAATNRTYDRVIHPNGLVQGTGAGSPLSVYAAPVGSTFLRTDGGTGTSLYVKESGTGTTGWVAK